jgi:uncharacterized membrane protein
MTFNGCGTGMGVGVVLAFFSPWLGLLVIAFFFGAVLVLAANEVFSEERADRRRARRQLAERADRQHAAVFRGDPYGVYGDYPPAKT